ncbi:unnamed protein product [Acanthosepion pharaonis]|uniref:Transmembrane protein n=1 Tax=Acanthosepion pharaonis TaxID=158019 RepID=A0A812EDA2_ACAPH|nr:unnamed protein product [Sepia pharaonis]
MDPLRCIQPLLFRYVRHRVSHFYSLTFSLYWPWSRMSRVLIILYLLFFISVHLSFFLTYFCSLFAFQPTPYCLLIDIFSLLSLSLMYPRQFPFPLTPHARSLSLIVSSSPSPVRAMLDAISQRFRRCSSSPKAKTFASAFARLSLASESPFYFP